MIDIQLQYQDCTLSATALVQSAIDCPAAARARGRCGRDFNVRGQTGALAYPVATSHVLSTLPPRSWRWTCCSRRTVCSSPVPPAPPSPCASLDTPPPCKWHTLPCKWNTLPCKWNTLPCKWHTLPCKWNSMLDPPLLALLTGTGFPSVQCCCKSWHGASLCFEVVIFGRSAFAANPSRFFERVGFGTCIPSSPWLLRTVTGA